MKAILVMIFAAAAAHADTLQTADLAKLRDPARRDAEVSRLADCDKSEHTLTTYRILTANQKESRPPLHVLCASYDYTPAGGAGLHDDYAVENPAELFEQAAGPVASAFEPSLDPVHDSVILVFDAKGREVRPFGGNNYTNYGYYFDFDQDGVLDRADSTNYGVKEAPKHSVEVFELQSIEPTPRTLLEVVFNWHPRSAPDTNDWTFTCFDENQDGFVEIAFGPESAATESEQRQFVFRRDPATGQYSAGEIPENAHIRVVQPGETLASIAKSGGLAYPVIRNPSDPQTEGPIPPSPQAPYVFQSLKDRPDSELAAFFQGKARRDSWDGPEDSFSNRLPEDFWKSNPKQAALALAEANRTPSHRMQWKLVIDDRHGIAPPESGWLLHDWGSSGCYSYSSHLFALRFGVAEPSLIVFGYNSIGVVGRNPWADQPAHNVRIIKLSETEARFLADTIFWLDRVRSFSLRKNESHGFSSSTADGFATVSMIPDQAPPRQLAAETIWATSTISGSWDADYTPTVFANLAEFLIADSFPKLLGDRWNTAPEIDRHSLTTSTEERLAPRVDADARQQLAESYSAILARHAKDPIPANALKEIAQAAGSEALTGLLPALQKLLAGLPPPVADDKEFGALEKRFEKDHFGDPFGDDPADHKEAYKRLEELREQRKFLPSAILRDPLSEAIGKLQLAQNPSELMNEAAGNGPNSRWALTLLRRIDLDAWSDLIADQFQKADAENRRQIFATLAAGSPAAAGQLTASLTPPERLNLIIEIARLHQNQKSPNAEDDLPGLMKVLRDKNQDYARRDEAMTILAEMDLPAAMLNEFTNLLVDEIRNPQNGRYGLGTLDSAIRALTRLPSAADHIDLITKTPDIPQNAFGAGFDAILHMTDGLPQRKDLLAGFILPRFEKCSGAMNDCFFKILTYELRNLATDVSGFATESPAVTDGDGADYSGGNFKTPVGQRYHIAREITALWAETDPATLARMWVFFVAAHPYEFDPERGNPELRDLAAKHIRTLPPEHRRKTIKSALSSIPIPEYQAATEAWLGKLNP